MVTVTATRSPEPTTARTPNRPPGRSAKPPEEGCAGALIGAAATRLGGLALGMVLARLLTPKDFGAYAIALSAMYFVMHVNGVGLLTYIVIVLPSDQRRRWSANAFAFITARPASLDATATTRGSVE
jgi:Polysaccharide biosynthesis protein